MKKILIAVGALLILVGGAGAAKLATSQTITDTITVPYTIAGQTGQVVVSHDLIVPVETVTVTVTDTTTTTPPPPPPPPPTTTTTPPPPPPSGNVYVSPAGSDSNACTPTSPCRTLSRGYSVAKSGDTISITGGSYPGVSITGTKSVTFQATGDVTITGQVDFNHGQNVTMAGPITIKSGSNDWDVRTECARNITLRNVSGRLIWIYNGSDTISFYGGSWGGYTGIEDSAVSGYNGGGASTCSPQGDGIVRNVLFDGVRFHDVNYGPSSTWGGAHPDCLQLMGGIDGLTVRNSVFERCGNTFLGWYPDFGDNKNLLVENNLFRAVYESSWAMQIGYKPTGGCSIVFRYNTVDTSVGGSDVPSLIRCNQGQAVYGNIFTRGIGSDPSYCVPGYSYNVYEHDPCGTNAVVGSPGWVSRSTSATSSYDYHLISGALAAGKGDPSRFPATDFEGTTRDAPPDAGYDER